MLRSVSIRTRLTLLYTGLLFLSLVLTGAAAVRLLRARLTDRVHASLDARIQGVENFLRRETTAQTAHLIPLEIEEYAFTQPEGHLIRVTDQAGHVLLRSEPAPTPSIHQDDAFTIYDQTYYVRAWASLAGMEASLRELQWLLIAMTPFLLLLTAALGYWISGRALSPVDGMTRLARSIGLADLSKRLPVPAAKDELSRLAEAWNEMLSRLEASVNGMQRFTADAAHELRTPLTALRTTAELAVRRERQSVEYRESLEQVVTIAERMSNLLDELLTLARGDGPKQERSFGKVDLAGLIRTVAIELQPLFDTKYVRLTTALQDALPPVSGDAMGLKRLLTSLLENGLKYTPQDGTVCISLRAEGSAQVLEVADSGCGIPAESLPHLFDRFYRVDSARDRRSGGYGLGLAIAQQIARFHGTEIEVGSAVGQGSRFTVRLPSARPVALNGS
jgi:two-component system, OmpR family, heavy metal sensor histidine kinase CusS